MSTTKVPSVLMVGTGEYTTGYVGGTASASDKKIGVIALSMFDLRSAHRGAKLDQVKMVGTNGTKFPGIRKHFEQNIKQVYNDMEVDFTSFPADDVRDPNAVYKAIETMSPHDVVTVVTPDDTHFDIAKAAIERGCHVLITKPPVKTLKEQLELLSIARKHNVLVGVEYHKRFDPIYADAREKARNLGDFSYFYSYMSQPKFQLETFRAWAGKQSDISYYLNSHHIDVHAWMCEGRAIPVRVSATASNGIANSAPWNCVKETEDTISLTVQWKNLKTGNLGTAVYTASWVAPKSDVHSQQRFHYVGAEGEMMIDQAHRGFVFNHDAKGATQSINPLYMKYTPDSLGRFSGQSGYGYKSIEEFVNAATQLRNNAKLQPEQFDQHLPTLKATLFTTAILECGRRSLDEKCAYIINYDEQGQIATISAEQK